ncbi:MAG: SUMF1/EgtB/PvdO family nonheme iron enzyme [Sedimentisphaerales bacterium]
MKNVRVLIVFVCFLAAMNITSADTIRGINIDFVTIGHAGNVGDTRTGTDEWGQPLANPYGCGAVSYNYRIGKYEVTNAQWNAFTTVAGAPTGNPSYAYDQSAYWTGTDVPTNRVSWYEAAQFCNYLTSGNKSLGAYQLHTNGSITVNRASAISSFGIAYVIPTEDEWYKAAYFKPDGSGYSLYANGTDTAPIASVQSNYNEVIDSPWNVGTGTVEQNGTFDMMGNVWEWNETLIDSSYHGIRGGSYNTNGGPGYYLISSTRSYVTTYNEDPTVGFRVASVPEPATLLLLSLGVVMLRKKR